MNRQAYEAYLACFNTRDYDGVLAHFHEDAVIAFAEVTLKGHDAIRRFYAFFHDHVAETIRIERFLANDTMLVIEAAVRLEAKRNLSARALAKAGYPSIVPLTRGQVFEMPQFIHYHIERGKFTAALCAMAAFAA